MIDYRRNLSGFSIMLVEPDLFIRDAMRDAFEGLDCSVTISSTAEDGLKLLVTGCFDVVISDTELPGLDGLNFIKVAASICPQSLRVLLTGYGDLNCSEDIQNYGVDEIFEKPFDLTELFDAIIRNFNEYQSRMAN
jgi:two-component system C4-dicarboxylate transport response regulator DctD